MNMEKGTFNKDPLDRGNVIDESKGNNLGKTYPGLDKYGNSTNSNKCKKSRFKM